VVIDFSKSKPEDAHHSHNGGRLSLLHDTANSCSDRPMISLLIGGCFLEICAEILPCDGTKLRAAVDALRKAKKSDLIKTAEPGFPICNRLQSLQELQYQGTCHECIAIHGHPYASANRQRQVAEAYGEPSWVDPQ
jgi:hypothetical protein